MTDELAAARRKIDALDLRIAALLARRFAAAAPLRRLKGKAADPARERRVLANARRAAGKTTYAAGVSAVFSEIVRQTKRLQPR
ncbi:MAG: chorismate mutase [Elusimicrobiales bacterium]